MTSAALYLMILALLPGGACLWMLLHPVSFQSAWTAFPRKRLPGQVFTLLALLGFAYNLWGVDFGGLSVLKRLLIPAVPVGWFLITVYLPDLLAVRGLAAVLLLAGQPLLVETRWQGTPASIVFGVLVYMAIVKSMFLVAYPHLWIRFLRWAFAEERRTKALAAGGLVFSAALLVVAWISR